MFVQHLFANLYMRSTISLDGAKAFDDIQAIIEKLGDTYGKGLSWEKEQTSKLKLTKCYLKGDYKVEILLFSFIV